MPGNEKREGQRVPVALRIKLRFRKVDTFVSKFATNISTRGMFISSRKPKEPGTQLRFELRLADDSTVIAGRGVVTWTREFDAERPKEPHGMGIAFVGLSEDSKALIARMVALRIEKGLGDEGIPYALDESRAEPSSRTGQDAERSLLDREVDMRKVLNRARSIAGQGALDAELARLSRVSAAPVAESVDVASNELAKLLGGAAVVTKHDGLADPPTDHSGLGEEAQDELPVVEDAAPREASAPLGEAEEAPASDEPEPESVPEPEPESAPEDGLESLEDSVDSALPVLEDDDDAMPEAQAEAGEALDALPELEDELAEDELAEDELAEDELAEDELAEDGEAENEPQSDIAALPELEDDVAEAEALDVAEDEAHEQAAPPSGEATVVGSDPLSLALDALDEGTSDRELDELSASIADDEGSEGITDAEALAAEDPAFLMEEEPTRVGASLEAFAAYEAETAAIANEAPYGRAQTEVQDPDSYGELVAEQEFAGHSSNAGEAPPLEDVLGALEAEAPSTRAQTEDVDELDVLEDIEVASDDDSIGTTEYEVLDEESAPSPGLDEALASFGDADSEDLDVG